MGLCKPHKRKLALEKSLRMLAGLSKKALRMANWKGDLKRRERAV
jgi:hypothetical protein